jgi:DNA-binding response OmpR family regulator
MSPPILIVDDDQASRRLLSKVLGQAGYTTREATSGEAALEAARGERPRLVLLEVRLPDLSGYEVCHELRKEFGDGLPIVFLSGERTESYDRVAGLMIGADDYLPKPFATDELLARVRALLRRASTTAVRAMPAELTRREAEVLALLTDGLEQAEIAERLSISPKTVATHIEHILEKLGVRSRAQAVAVAYRTGLIAIPL